MSTFHKLPSKLKPREKLILKGGNSLNIIELLAIVLGTGSKNDSVIKIAYNLIEKYNGINNLINQEYSELLENDGIGESKAVRIKALKYIMQEIEDEKNEQEKVIVDNPLKIYKFMKKYSELEEENLFVICLANDNAILHYKMIFRGTLASLVLNPREIFKYVLEHNSSKMCLVHNHPSGNVTPSSADLKTTKELVKIAQLVDIEIVDHIIIGSMNYCSLKEKYAIIF